MTRRLMVAIEMMTVMLSAGPAQADVQPGPGATDGRLRILTDAFAASDSAAAGRIVAGAALLHRFTAQLLDSSGAVPVERAGWSAVIRVVDRAGAVTTLVRVGSGAEDIVLPRPMAFRVEAGDSLEVIAVLRDGAAGAVRLQVTIAAETESAASRWAVLPVAERVRAEGAALAWEWTAPATGRLLAAALPLDGAAEVVLEEVRTGAIVWRMTVPDEDAATFSRAGRFVRPGVSVVAGESYRFVVLYRSSVMDGETDAMAVLLPDARSVTVAGGA